MKATPDAVWHECKFHNYAQQNTAIAFPSVCPSHAGIVLIWVNWSSSKQSYIVAEGLIFPTLKILVKFQLDHPKGTSQMQVAGQATAISDALLPKYVFEIYSQPHAVPKWSEKTAEVEGIHMPQCPIAGGAKATRTGWVLAQGRQSTH